MTKLQLFWRCQLAAVLSAISVAAAAQNLIGNWDLIESADGQGDAAGQMVLSRDGSMVFNGDNGTWRASGNTVTLTLMGSAGVPAMEASLDLGGNVLRGSLTSYSYRLQNSSPVRTGQRSFPLSARRPAGYAQQESTPAADSSTLDRRGAEQQSADRASQQASADTNPPRTGGRSQTSSRAGSANHGNGSSSGQAASPQKKAAVEAETCVLEGTGICRGGATAYRKGGTFYVKQPNNCGYRLYARICIKTKSGSDDCGADSIRPGGSTSMWHSSDDSTGQFTVTAVGVLKGGDDWTCMGKKRDLGTTD